MITREEIDTTARDLQVGPTDVERDYVFGWLLANLFNESRLRERLVLKGGNALRKGYFANTRYSGDLDFACEGGIDVDDLRTGLVSICDATSARTGVTFLNDQAIVREKSRIDPQLQVIEARLYFSDFYGRPGSVTLKVRMDVTQFEQLMLAPQQRPLIHAYSDASSCAGAITCVSLEEILASKLKCLIQRRHVADLFDYAHWLFFSPEHVDAGLVLSIFLKKTIYGSHPGAALELLLGLPFHALRELWSRFVVCPVRSLIVFEEALPKFVDHLRTLFGVEPSTSPPGWWSQTLFFPSALRNVILDAGSRMTLVRMKYKGTERLVEPYSLRYKQRRDGGAREYFYAYDQTGGRSSGPGLKSFVADDFQEADVTDLAFEPRYDVEVAKAGDIAQAGRFVRRRSVPGFGITRRRPGGGPQYAFRCAACGRVFIRSTFDTNLREHRNGKGGVCAYSHGVYVRTK